MNGQTDWHTSERLAWTDHDGPGRPPGGSHPVANLALAAVLAAVFTGMVLSDSLCPEHRAWIQALGSVALVGCVASAIALVRGWSTAPAFTAVTAIIGVGIGYLDATHDATRGWLVAAAFVLALVGAVWLCLQQVGLRLWEREQARRGRVGSPAVASDTREIASDEPEFVRIEVRAR